MFRADSLDSAVHLYWAMAGGNGLEQGEVYANELADWNAARWNIGGLLLVVWLLPNTQQWLAGYRPVLEQVAGVGHGIWLKVLRWRPSVPQALMMAVIFYWSVLHLSQVSEYIYFHF